MSDGFVQVAPDGTGKKIDNSELTVGANVVERQRINIADGSDASAIALVSDADPDPRDYGLAVRPLGTADQDLTHQLLFQILAKLNELVELTQVR